MMQTPARQVRDHHQRVEHAGVRGNDEAARLVRERVERTRVDSHESESLGARPGPAMDPRNGCAPDQGLARAAHEDPDQRRQDAPDHEHETELGDHEREQDALPESGARAAGKGRDKADHLSLRLRVKGHDRLARVSELGHGRGDRLTRAMTPLCASAPTARFRSILRHERRLGCRSLSSTVTRSPDPHPKANQLLAALPAEEWRRWLPQLEPVEMPLGQVLYESGSTLSHVYFPTTSIVSLLYVMENGSSAEIAVVGNEGIVGISLFMGGESTPSRAVVQSAGQGFRLKASTIKEEFKRAPVLHLLLRYTQALITQMAQTAVCNRHHSLDQQLCRWLLLSLDRLGGNELVMTQELIANMLGVRREGVTEGAVKLQKAGLIQYSRGRITVLDRPGLEARSCECYAVVKKEYDRLLPPVVAS
jgi:CRP-like cAMP-binding protein